MIDCKGLKEDVYPSFFNCNHCNCNQQPLFLSSSIRPSSTTMQCYINIVYMGVSKDVIKQCLISKQREVDEAVIVNRPVEFEEINLSNK